MRTRVTRSFAVAAFSAGGLALLTQPAAAFPAIQNAFWRTDILPLLANPDIVFALLLIGIYGLMLEAAHPGIYFPGLIGAIGLTLAVIAMAGMPVNYGALLLLLVGVALMTAETFTPSFGALGIGGFIAFVAGSNFLFSATNGANAISLPVIAGSAIACAGMTFFVLGAALKARHRPVKTGSEAMIGAPARVIEWKGGEGVVLLAGERWAARGANALKSDDAVRVTARDGLIVTVASE